MDDPIFRENNKKFYQHAYRVSRTNSLSSDKGSTDVALNQNTLQRRASTPATMSNKNMSISQIQRHQPGDHTFRNVLLFLIFAGIFIFAVDLYKEIQQEKIELQVKRKKCHTEYMQNECENAFDAIKAKCHELQMCFKHDVDMTLRTSQSAVKLLGKLISVFLNETGWFGAALVVVLAIIMLNFIYKASRSTNTHQMTFKKE